ncbi:hypothetical protein RQP53_06960 [Paucibacter sp. APW11]|uniref:DUF1439 domain-containing protein n=1 Tax=Roseateles aquae TaxID=3077235 RepID=A0ABU3P8W0_9BURK|nr:hypothetical protein [Paucibacter sp. APW11]MDT8999004.1 hypothetical protein [Paucibacter sp. APW11]
MQRFLKSRRTLFATPLLLASVLLPGCATGPRTVTLGETELNLLLSRQMPVEKRVLELLDTRLSAPQLRLLPERNRLALSLQLSWRERLSGHEGQTPLTLEFALRWDEATRAIRAQQVELLEPGSAGGSGRQALASRAAKLLAEQWLEGQAIYRFKPDDLTKAEALGLKPRAVTVTSRGVEITLAAS